MKYLAFDTSASRLTVAVGGNKNILKSVDECFHSHSVILMQEIEQSLQSAMTDLSEIDVFACSVGPGSFTGIRIGVSTAKAFAYALSKKVLGVTSFESLAYNIVDKTKKLTIIDARHDNFYVCGFDENNVVILEPCFKTKQEIIDLYGEFLIVSDVEIEGVNCIVGNMAEGFVKAVEAKISSASYNRESVVPLYVKKSQAEEEL
ncbi:MAG: tRNA (adenosine(37)-N6)-threonylcarbamoyltransferase complex dimerization subunit type 1 TsaB [Clostridia bacterium]|nr:tRNA (adenosine(37)-N6)-threonylcarbamoyltransferase complex dimerization subunit type 1 TsaB [Clostridia bacterium]